MNHQHINSEVVLKASFEKWGHGGKEDGDIKATVMKGVIKFRKKWTKHIFILKYWILSGISLLCLDFVYLNNICGLEEPSSVQLTIIQSVKLEKSEI